MIGKLLAMFGLATRKVKPDPISAEIAIASQRNEQASLKARIVLEELLSRNDGLRGSKR